MLQVKRSGPVATRNRVLSAILTCLPGAWIQPSDRDLVALYRMRYRMAMEENKYDAAMIFLNKILEVEPLNLEAKLDKGELFHRHLQEYDRAIEQYTKVIRLTSSDESSEYQKRARGSMSELMEMFS